MSKKNSPDGYEAPIRGKRNAVNRRIDRGYGKKNRRRRRRQDD